MSRIEFLSLGKQPIANAFLKDKKQEEYFFDLAVQFDTESKIVSLVNLVEKEKLFNETYVYDSSMSNTMVEHFQKTARYLGDRIHPKTVLEIGSNSGIFINNFDKDSTFAVEPCANFAERTNEMGYKTYPEFWNKEMSQKIVENHGKIDLVYAANCFCHIPEIDEVFQSAHNVLSSDGVLVFEDPTLLSMIVNNSFDQIYDEHVYIFSVVALNEVLKRNGMKLWCVENLPKIHGGSNRIYAVKDDSKRFRFVDGSVRNHVQMESSSAYDLNKTETYFEFSSRVKDNVHNLLWFLEGEKKEGKRIIGYGATSKSTVVFNYAGLGTDIFDCIVDTTPEKQGTFSPGKHIPVVSPEEGLKEKADLAFLGAWNFTDEIRKKELERMRGGMKLVTHVPNLKVLSV